MPGICTSIRTKSNRPVQACSTAWRPSRARAIWWGRSPRNRRSASKAKSVSSAISRRRAGVCRGSASPAQGSSPRDSPNSSSVARSIWWARSRHWDSRSALVPGSSPAAAPEASSSILRMVPQAARPSCSKDRSIEPAHGAHSIFSSAGTGGTRARRGKIHSAGSAAATKASTWLATSCAGRSTGITVETQETGRRIMRLPISTVLSRRKPPMRPTSRWIAGRGS